jgi:murein DD-endopeptidase MepM/ murein hydrolase activator NlpD
MTHRRGVALLAAASLAGCAAIASPKAPELRGSWVQGGVLVGQVAPGTDIRFNGGPVRVAKDGHFLIGLGRDAESKGELVLRAPHGVESRYEFAVAQRKYDVQRVDGLPEDKVNPPPEALPRIERDMAAAKAARLRETDRADFAETFVWPCIGRISGSWGSQRILNGTPKQPHFGVDIAVPTGTKIVAPAGGVVSLAEKDMYYSGGTLMIDHGLGLSSTFMHLSKLLVKTGQEVRQGQVIAESGATGRASGPHLHWGMTWLDVRVDASQLVGPMPAAEQGSAAKNP